MRRTPSLIVVTAILACAALAGCGGKSGGGTAVTARGQASSQTSAARLRADLTRLLVDDVFATGDAIHATLAAGADPQAAAPATAALDASAVALSQELGRFDGAPAASRFLALWRNLGAALEDYAKGRKAQDEIAVQQALGTLDELRGELGDALHAANPDLGSKVVADDLKSHVEALIAAIDATVAASDRQTRLLATAAAHMPITAALLADGIAASHDKGLTGTPGSGGATLVAGLTGLFAGDAHLTLLVSAWTVRAGRDAASVRDAQAAQDANAVALSELVSSVYGEDAGQKLLDDWRRQAAQLAAYTKGKLGGGAALTDAALSGMTSARADLVEHLTAVDPALPRRDVETALDAYATALTGAIRAQVADSPKRYTRSRDAAVSAARLAATLARAMTVQFPDKFPAQ